MEHMQNYSSGSSLAPPKNQPKSNLTSLAKAEQIAAETAPDVEISSVRFMQKQGAKLGTLSVVVGGVHYLWPCKRSRALYVVEDIMTALRRDDEARTG